MAPPTAQPRILTVTDSLADQRVLSEVLGAEHKVIPATSASNALLLLAREPVDVVLAELKLPRESGADFLREIGQSRDVGRVLLADYGAYAQRPRQASDAFFLAIKPIHPTGLLRAVNQALTHVRMARSAKAAARKVSP